MLDFELAHELLSLLKEKHLTLGSIESLTAGLFSSTICSVPGASSVFKGAVVTYWSETKEDVVHVKHETIEKYHVVSKEVAQEMAENGRALLHVDICVSFTGNAGPTAEPGEAPVGEVHMAIAAREQTILIKTLQSGSRNEIRESCVNMMLQKLKEFVSK